jgi:hypothetical protein
MSISLMNHIQSGRNVIRFPPKIASTAICQKPGWYLRVDFLSINRSGRMHGEESA